MNSPSSRLPARGQRQPSAFGLQPFAFLMCFAASFLFTGCHLFQPDTTQARHFILSPVDAPPATNAPPVMLGVGQVKLPGYLFENSFAVRRGTNEIDYLPMSLWAERLDTGIQRVLAANLATLLPAEAIRLSAWQREDVAVGLYVTVVRFDVDANGRGELVAWWRLVSPDGTQVLKTGQSRYTHDGPKPASDPQGAVANLSGLLGDFSRELAQTIREMKLTP